MGARAVAASAARREAPSALPGGVLDSRPASLYNARSFQRPAIGGFGAQVAQLVEHVTENHGVGGSIPPLGTKSYSHSSP